MFSFISNSCVSLETYKLYYPWINQYFLEYNNPFIGSLFLDDEKYVKFCENYDYYVSIEPIFGEPENKIWEKDFGSKRYMHPDVDQNYIVMYLGDIEIHWIHETNKDLLLKKYKGRLETSKNYRKIFLWCDAEVFNYHSDEERKNLVNRFNKIHDKTIFLTKYKNEEFIDDSCIVKFIEIWENRSMYERVEKVYILSWSDHNFISKIFKEIIDKYFLKFLSIRDMREDDLYFFNEVRNSCAQKFLHDSRIFSTEEVFEWFKNTKNKYYIILLYENEKIGYFRTSNYSEINKSIYIGADLHEKWRGKKLAYNSYNIFINYLFKEFNLHEIILEVLETNERAINLYKKLNFKKIGLNKIYKNNILTNSIIMNLFDKKYLVLKKIDKLKFRISLNNNEIFIEYNDIFDYRFLIEIRYNNFNKFFYIYSNEAIKIGKYVKDSKFEIFFFGQKIFDINFNM